LFRTAKVNLGLVFLVIIPLLFSACDRTQEAKIDKITDLNLTQYYPLNNNSYWAYDWDNSRGDSWHGAITVTSMSEARIEHRVYLIVDTTVKGSKTEISSSAYLWDDDGLKHLYRIAANGDSACYHPPRIVIPSVMQKDSIYRYNYHYEVYSSNGNIPFKGDVKQQYRIHKVGTVKTDEGTWKDAVAIESQRRDDFPNGEVRMNRALIWYARDVGPVKIITGIPPDADQPVGDMTGILVDWR